MPTAKIWISYFCTKPVPCTTHMIHTCIKITLQLAVFWPNFCTIIYINWFIIVNFTFRCTFILFYSSLVTNILVTLDILLCLQAVIHTVTSSRNHFKWYFNYYCTTQKHLELDISLVFNCSNVIHVVVINFSTSDSYYQNFSIQMHATCFTLDS